MHRTARTSLLACLVGLMLLIAPGASLAKTEPADTVLHNGHVVTLNPKRASATAVAVRDGRIAFLGSDQAVKKLIGPHTKVVNLRGRLVLPSFSDAHCHVQSAVSFLYAVNLYGLPSLAELLSAVQSFAAQNPSMPAIQGNGWSEALFPGIGPRKEDLDAVVNDRPVALWSDGHHSLWVNSAALALAGIDGNTPDPDKGVIERIPGTVGLPGSPYGIPSGTLRESATDLVTNALPDFTVDQYVDGLRFYQETIAGPLGITLVHDALLVPGSNAVKAYERLARRGELTMRVRASLLVAPGAPVAEQIAAAAAERAKHKSGLFQTNAVKFFEDGVIEGHTGYLLEDYADRPGYRGEAIWPLRELKTAFLAADKAGFQIHVHAIGDAAVDEALDALAYTQAVHGRRDRRAMITHLQLVDPNDIVRMGRLGVTALPQPYWFLKDDYYYNLQVPFLGQVRADLEYPMRSFFKAGVRVASSSDFPVTPEPNALMGIQAGVMRWLPTSVMGGEPAPGDVLWPAERATVGQMIRSFTFGGAYANFLENTTGSLRVGKSADMVVLKRDILKCAPDKIGTGNKVLLTLFRGKQVFKDPSF